MSRDEAIVEFVAGVVNEDGFPLDGPVHLVMHVQAHKEAFRQFIMEVILVQSISAVDWLADEYRQRQGWVKAVEQGYEYYRSMNDE